MSLELVQKNMILMSLNGSTLYGTSTETSDIDYMGVYIEDPFNVFLGPPMESVQLNSKPNDRKREANEEDGQAYSVRKFCKLVAQGNPSVLNVLFTHGDYLKQCDPLGKKLLDHKEYFISKQAGPRFIGYMQSQLSRLKGEKVGHIPTRPDLVAQYGYDVKYAGHVVRLGLQGFEYLNTGQLSVPMTRHDRELVQAVRSGKYTLKRVIEMADQLLIDLHVALQDSPLPPDPQTSNIATLIQEIYTEFWTR
jgi:hypothetical protein